MNLFPFLACVLNNNCWSSGWRVRWKVKVGWLPTGGDFTTERTHACTGIKYGVISDIRNELHISDEPLSLRADKCPHRNYINSIHCLWVIASRLLSCSRGQLAKHVLVIVQFAFWFRALQLWRIVVNYRREPMLSVFFYSKYHARAHCLGSSTSPYKSYLSCIVE